MNTCDRPGVLGYTIDDDGVWLECDGFSFAGGRSGRGCGFRKNLGFSATVGSAITAESEHHNRELSSVEVAS